MNKNKKIIVLLLSLLPLFTWAQFTETREIEKSFAVNKETRIELSNKYGKIDINTWDKDSVLVKIKVRVEEKKLSKLEEKLRGIDFDIRANEHYLVIRTSVGKNKSSFAKEITRFKESLLKSDGSTQVDYLVWIPHVYQLRVENKFGDIYVDDFDGEAHINLSNGNLKAHNFNERLELNLNFADASINSINKGELICNFSELYVRKANSLRLWSKSSEYEFQQIKEITALLRRDKFRIRQIDWMDTQSSFSNIRISKLSDKLKINAEYGDIEIEETSNDFSKIDIQSKSTDINLFFNSETALEFEVSHTNADVDFSSEFEQELIEHMGSLTKITGFKEEKNSTGKVFIKADSGAINIRSN